ncbi:MAG: CoA-binding protein [Candidatus Hydrogenedens sp.]|jgi:predicted CoA-binding protein|nr:CoA-binding protein [Candidatus Hydrogenedens sp.]
MNSIAIVGASSDRKKYGNKALRAFVEGGWKVFPVNKAGGIIEGLEVFTSLDEITEKVDRVSMYLPAALGITMLDQVLRKMPCEFYLNPGSESDELIALAREKGLEPIQACSIVNIGLRPDMFSDD